MHPTIAFILKDDTTDTPDNAARIVANLQSAGISMVMPEWRVWNACPLLCSALRTHIARTGAHFDPAPFRGVSSTMWDKANRQLAPSFGFCDNCEFFSDMSNADGNRQAVRFYVERFRDYLQQNAGNRPAWIGASSVWETLDLCSIHGSRDQDWTVDPLTAATNQARRLLNWRGSGGGPLGDWNRFDIGWWGERDDGKLYPPDVYGRAWALTLAHNFGITYRSHLTRWLRDDAEAQKINNVIAQMESAREAMG